MDDNYEGAEVEGDSLISSNTEGLVKLIGVVAKLGIKISSVDELNELLELVLKNAKSLANADGGTLYVASEDGNRLQFSIMLNDSLDIYEGGLSSRRITLPPLIIRNEATGEYNHKNVATFCSLKKEIVNIENAYEDKKFDFSGTYEIDSITKYKSVSFLTIPLLSNENKVLAVIQLINAQDQMKNIIKFNKETQLVVHTLCAIAESALNSHQFRPAHW